MHVQRKACVLPPSSKRSHSSRTVNERKEEAALVNPRAGALRAALESFLLSAADEVDAAAQSALKLSTSTPLHETHVLVIQMNHLINEPDPSIAMDVCHVGAYTPAEIARAGTLPTMDPPLSEIMSPGGLDRHFLGMRKVSKAKLKVAVIWHVAPDPCVPFLSCSPRR